MVTELSATPGDDERRRFPGEAIDPGSHPVLERRLLAPKPVRLELVKVSRDAQQATLDLASGCAKHARDRSEEHTSELQSLMRISYAVCCLKKKTNIKNEHHVATA